MQILPLVLHAGLILPRHTTLFSDTLAVSSITVAEGDVITITCSESHGCPVGEQMAVSITDADTPNPITDAEVDGDGNILLTTQYPHDLTTTPDPNRFRAWHTTAKVTGFASGLINGTRQLISVDSDTTFTIAPGGTVTSVTLTGNEKLLERLEYEVIGWHAATATSATELTIPTPSAVTRSYTVANPSVVTSIRVQGAVNLDAALMQFSPEDGASLDKPWMFICPLSAVRASRSGSARTDALAEMNPSMDVRQMLLDGFQVNVLMPTAETVAHVRAVDLCQGEVFTAVLKTFFGLRLPRPELSDGESYTAHLDTHTGGMTKDRAVYIHQYEFQCPAYLTSEDAISPWEWAAIAPQAYTAAQTSLADGGALSDGLSNLPTTGAVSFRGIDLTGILHDGKPQPLTASTEMDY